MDLSRRGGSEKFRNRERASEKAIPRSLVGSEESLVDEKEVRKILRERERERGLSGDKGRYRDRDEEVFVEKRRESRAASRAPSYVGRDRERDYEEIVVTEERSEVGAARRDSSRMRGNGSLRDSGYRGSFVEGRR